MLKFLLKSCVSWGVFLGVILRHPLHRFGFISRPNFTDHYDASQRAWGQATRWNPRLRVVHPERCPKTPPAIFAANHSKLDDPFFIWRSVHRATGETLHCKFVMRDDWGRGLFWKLFPIPFNDLGEMAGAMPISRDNVTLAQMKPMLQVLLDRGAFIIFPGRSRSRSGLIMEYRDGIEDPGGISFFLATGERRMPGTRIPAVPVARTHNPMTWKSAVVFGEPMFLTPGASRAEQREFDFALAAQIGALVEINVLHLVCGLLYLHCLHRPSHPELDRAKLCFAVAELLRRLEHPYVNPVLQSDASGQCGKALRWLRKQGVLHIEGNQVRLEVARILSEPTLEGNYRKLNPVKYHVNQILHLGQVVTLLEESASTLNR